MAIYFSEKDKFISIKTENTEYQMKIDDYGVLRHLWYGEKVNTDMSYLIKYPDVGFSGNPYDAGNDRTYSLDTLPLEYACGGIGDFRISALSLTHENGSTALDLRYKSCRIYKGKYSIAGLPAVYAGENEAETLEITLQDIASEVKAVLRYGVVEKYDIITRNVKIINGDRPVTLQKAASLCLDIPNGNNPEWIHFHGRHISERLPERRPLFHGIQESSSSRGTSSHQQNPSVILCSPDCTETSGSCIGACLVYSGSFQTQIEYDQLDQTRLVMGINPNLFKWRLEPYGEFETPEVILSYSGRGFSRLSYNFHNIIREHICRGKYKTAERPVLINSWEAAYFDFDEEKIIKIAEAAADMGLDMLVLDDGWFGERNDDCSGLGDWFENKKKLPEGLKGLAEKINALDMSFGLWIEPEMVSENSRLYKTHPDWAIRVPNRKPTRGRFQLVLDMSRQDVQDYLFEAISDILKNADISYIKWDMNRSICDLYSSALEPERQGEFSHRYVLGLYALLERLTSAFPDVLWEGCSGGGGRFDAGMLYYCPQIWCSDDTDAYERTKIQYGTSFFYPVSVVGSHVSTVPNHQTGRTVPLESRAVTAMAGSLGYELDPNTLSDDERAQVRAQIKKYKSYRKLIHTGKYYRLTNPLKENSAVWKFVSENSGEVLIQGIIFRTEPNMKQRTLKLFGLEESSTYINEETGETYTGGALMNGGILLPETRGDYFPVEAYLRKMNFQPPTRLPV
ncbi:MAG: alpha-galactosidase [Clostridiales bacterium]|nr:alpha-galactosidase [Clostridiales bacterium]